MKKPWFIWLSLLAFFGLFAVLSVKQCAKLFRGAFDMERWIAFCGRCLGLFFLLFMLPGVLLQALNSAVFAEYSAAWSAVQCLILVYLYLICVWLNLQLYRWAKKTELL